MKRSRSDSVGGNPSSPTKKSRFIDPDSMSSEGQTSALFPPPAATLSFQPKSSISHQKSALSLCHLHSKAPDAHMERGIRNQSLKTAGFPDLILNTDPLNTANGSTTQT